MIEEGEVADLHLFPHVVPRLVIADPRPRFLGDFFEILDGEDVGFGFEEPVVHGIEPRNTRNTRKGKWLLRLSGRSHFEPSGKIIQKVVMASRRIAICTVKAATRTQNDGRNRQRENGLETSKLI
jgi:hypothetical protein